LNARRFVTLLAFLSLASPLAVPAAAAGAPPRWNLVPYPALLQPLDGKFEPRGGLRVVLAQPANREVHELADLAAEMLRENFGLRPTLVPAGAGARHGPALRLSLVALARGSSAESYVLEVTRESIAISAPSPAGLFHGLQTLRQLLADADAGPAIPALRIEDTPRFAYRGFRVDASREWLPLEALERWIELAARFKLNTLHWRLAGPEAWRLETLRYPRLNPAPGAGYSQEDVRRLLAFARQHHVTIVPEVPLWRAPAAAIAAYPELACGEAGPCPPPAAVEFAADVLGEVTGLFPGMVDLGAGDGAATGDLELWRRLATLLAGRGREAATAGLPPAGETAGVVLYRQGAGEVAAAARGGFEVIATGAVAGSEGPLAAAPRFAPVATDLTPAEQRRVRGAEVAFDARGPSASAALPAIAEALWSPAGLDPEDFAQRLAARAKDLAATGASVAPTPP
jgi:hexosaminidase